MCEVDRDDARRFVEWVESTFAVEEAEPGDPAALGPHARRGNGRKFFDSALGLARLMKGAGRRRRGS